MKCFFAIACWMLFHFAHLQAKPLPPIVLNELDTEMLRDHVSCGNMTFTTPTDVEHRCKTAALKCVLGELAVAQKNCTGTLDLISDTAEILEEAVLDSEPTTSPDCKWDNKESGRPFRVFAENIKTLAELHNSIVKMS